MCLSEGLVDRRGDLGIEDDAFLDRQGGDVEFSGQSSFDPPAPCRQR